MAATSRIGCVPNRNSCGTTGNGEVPTNTHDALNGVAQTKGYFMTFTKLILALACLMSGTLVAQEAKVTELMSKDLARCPGKEGLMITVEYPPGSKDPSQCIWVYLCAGRLDRDAGKGWKGNDSDTWSDLLRRPG